MTQIKLATRDDYAQIAALIAQQNAISQYRCLHSDEGSAEGVLHTMNEWADEESMLFFFATDENEQGCDQAQEQGDTPSITGAFGAEYDSELRRAWLWGPFAHDGENQPDAWLSLSTMLYAKLIDALPFQPTRLDGLIDQPFTLGAQFYESQGFQHASTAYVFVAPRPATIVPPIEPLPQLTAKDEARFAALFDVIFPKTFYTGEQIVQRLNDKEQVYLYREADDLLGFCHAKVNEGADEGYIEFIGVAEAARGRGIGKKLLLTAMHWLYTEHDMTKIGLTTEEENLNAQALYKRVGFDLIHTGLSYRL